MAQKTVVIIQARMGSTRLKGKTLVDISGKPLLQHILERVKKCMLIDDIVVATTVNKEDDCIVGFCDRAGTKSFRGSEEDVLDRYYQCAKQFKTDTIVRVTADDPFKDPQVIDKIIAALRDGESFDYVSNTIKPTFPEGIDVEAFTFFAIEKAWKEAEKKSDREHVTPYIWRNQGMFHICNFENSVDLSHLRWTLDTEADLVFTREIYKRLYQEGSIFLMDDILSALEKEPGLLSINSGMERNSGYYKSLREDAQ